jgi:hypothetical protein
LYVFLFVCTVSAGHCLLPARFNCIGIWTLRLKKTNKKSL